MRTIRIILACALLVPMAQSQAVDREDIRAQLDTLIAQEQLLPSGGYMEPPTAARKDELIDLLATDVRVAAAPRLTTDLVLRVIHDQVVQYRVTIDEARSLVSHYTETVDEVPAPKAVSHLVQLILPYAMDAGVCDGDPLSDDGASCTFAFAPPGSPVERVSGALGEDDAAMPVPAIDPDTPLYAVLSGCDPGDADCRALADKLTTPDPKQTSARPADDLLAMLRDFDYGRLFSLLGIGSAQAYIKTYKDQRKGESSFAYAGFQMRLAYGYAYYIKLRCGKAAGWGCDLWGEVVSVGNLKYLAAGSDMMMVVLPFAFHCPASCFYSGLASYAGSWIKDNWLGGSASSFDTASFAMSARDNATLRRSGSYSRLTARGGCGVVPVPHQLRPTHEAYRAWAQRTPYAEHFDLSPHTSFQMPATSPLTPLLSQNMDPQPTRASGTLPKVSCNPLPIEVNFNWTYDFLLVAAWNFNVIFAALDNLNAVNSCGPDQTWVWRGAAGSGNKALQALTWTFSFAGGHWPYVPLP